MNTQHGFTLIELMIVVAIVGILSAIAVPAYRDYTVRAKVTELMTSASACKTSFAEYYQSMGDVPTNAGQAGCSSLPTANAKAPVVSGGEIIVDAAGTLALQLAAGSRLGLKPDCGAAGCTGSSPIKGCNCSSVLGTSTTISGKFLPANCR
jgi:type IV pilus assembly protein PilA